MIGYTFLQYILWSCFDVCFETHVHRSINESVRARFLLSRHFRVRFRTWNAQESISVTLIPNAEENRILFLRAFRKPEAAHRIVSRQQRAAAKPRNTRETSSFLSRSNQDYATQQQQKQDPRPNCYDYLHIQLSSVYPSHLSLLHFIFTSLTAFYHGGSCSAKTRPRQRSPRRRHLWCLAVPLQRRWRRTRRHV